jgi:hypothetical protein
VKNRGNYSKLSCDTQTTMRCGANDVRQFPIHLSQDDNDVG